MHLELLRILLLAIHVVCASLPNGVACCCVKDSKAVCACSDSSDTCCSESSCCGSNTDCSRPGDSSGNPQDCKCHGCDCYFTESNQAKWKPADEPLDVTHPWFASETDTLLPIERPNTQPAADCTAKPSSHADRLASLCVWRN